MSDTTDSTLDTWQQLVFKRGRRSVVKTLIEQAESQIKDREKFISEATDENTLLGNKAELARVKADFDNLSVEDKIIDIEITALKVALGAADKSDLSDTVKKSMDEDAKDVDEA